MKDYGLMEVQLHAFLPFALYGDEQLIHFLATSSPDLVQTLGKPLALVA
jgi:hypothetical protein